ncbi:MAG: BON domain-containing protein, partial [Bacteriovorax sp.]
KARRVQIKDKSAKLKKESSIRAQRLMIHLRNKSEGLKAKALRAASKNEPVSDQRLEGRIRSAFGRIVRHSRPIKVSVKNGVATLSGPILTKEVNDIISCVKNVSGVKDVINKLDAHATSENIPGLQGAGPEFLH